MTDAAALSDLQTFALKTLAAERYPNDYHIFRAFECETCGSVPFSMMAEHHTDSKNGDFKGLIWGDCAQCSARKRLMSYTGDHRKKISEEKFFCECGEANFVGGEMERMEDGALGFFDEGVVVGQCSGCKRNRVIVATD